jgi:hypothetical protein
MEVEVFHGNEIILVSYSCILVLYPGAWLIFLSKFQTHAYDEMLILCGAIRSKWSILDISSVQIVDICFFLFQTLQRFAIVGLSNFYFDVAKDRLYVGYAIHLSFISICS